MILAARRKETVLPRDRDVDAALRRRAVNDLVRLAQEILLLDPAFERAFPRERTRAAASGLVASAQRLLAAPAALAGLGTPLRTAIERLCYPDRDGRRPKPTLPTAVARLKLADRLLDHALELDPKSSLAHVVLAQRSWLYADDLDGTRRSLERAIGCAATRASAAGALLHVAILDADLGRLDAAIELLASAERLDPDSFAAAWTLGVYALATDRTRLAERQLLAISRTADPASLRRRGLALPAHLSALARSGVLPAARVAERADAFLSRLPPIPAARNRS